MIPLILEELFWDISTPFNSISMYWLLSKYNMFFCKLVLIIYLCWYLYIHLSCFWICLNVLIFYISIRFVRWNIRKNINGFLLVLLLSFWLSLINMFFKSLWFIWYFDWIDFGSIIWILNVRFTVLIQFIYTNLIFIWFELCLILC